MGSYIILTQRFLTLYIQRLFIFNVGLQVRRRKCLVKRTFTPNYFLPCRRKISFMYLSRFEVILLLNLFSLNWYPFWFKDSTKLRNTFFCCLLPQRYLTIDVNKFKPHVNPLTYATVSSLFILYKPLMIECVWVCVCLLPCSHLRKSVCNCVGIVVSVCVGFMLSDISSCVLYNGV